MFIWHDKWCVYAHSVEGEIVYIGSGRAYRALDFRRRDGVHCSQSRGEDWHKATASGFNLLIIGWYGSRQEAMAEEKRLIGLIKPRCNVHWTGRKRKDPAKSEMLKNNAHRTGKPHSPEARQKMADAQKKAWEINPVRTRRCEPVKCIETGEVFPSKNMAAKSISRSAGRLGHAIKHNRQIAGLTFEKLER